MSALADRIRYTTPAMFSSRRADLIAEADQLATDRDRWKREALQLRSVINQRNMTEKS